MVRPLRLVTAACLLLAGAAPAAEVRTLGETWDEPVTSIREEGGRLVVRTATRSIPLEQVKSIRYQDETPAPGKPGARRVAVRLTGGDLVRGDLQAAGQDGVLSLDSRGLGPVAVPFELVRAVLIECSPERERQLEAGLDPLAQRDGVVLQDGGPLVGTVKLIDAGRVVIDTSGEDGSNLGEKFTVGAAKVELITFAGDPPPAASGLRVQARLIDGTCLTGALVAQDESGVQLVHPLGALSIPLARLAELVVQGGAFVYVSDLPPRAVQQGLPPGFTPQPDLWGWKRDLSVSGSALRLGGRTFDKGLGVHSYCALTFALDGAYRSFHAVIGLDDSTRHLGEPGFGGVVFKVLVDGRPAKEQPAEGWAKRKGEPPTTLAIDVSGARAITLIVDFDPTTLHILGRADWADAHLIKP